MENNTHLLKQFEKELFEAKLKLSEIAEKSEKFNLLINHMHDILWFMDESFKISYVSPSIYHALGYTDTEFIAIPLNEHCYDDTLSLINEWQIKRQQGNTDATEKHLTFHFKHKNGSPVWLETISKPVINNESKYMGSIGVSRDVTTKIAQEQKILENEAYLKSLFENTTDSIWSIDTKFCIKTLNTNFRVQFKNAFGYELNPGSPILDYLPQELKETWYDRYYNALQGVAFTVTDKFLVQDKEQYMEVRFNPIWIEGKIIGVSVFAREITESELVKKALEESNANLWSIIESTNARIWSVDRNYNILVVNRNLKNDYYKAFQFELKKGTYAIGNTPPQVEEIWKERYKRAFGGEQFILNDEFNYDDVPRFTQTVFTPIKMGKEVIGVSCFSQDVTEQRKAQEINRQNENKFRVLIQASVDLLTLTDENSIYEYLVMTLQETLQVNSVVVFSIDSKSQTGTFKGISCVDTQKQHLIQKELGFRMHGNIFPIPDTLMSLFQSPSVLSFEKPVYEYFQNISVQKKQLLEQLISNGFYYSISLIEKKHVNAVLLFYNSKPLQPSDYSFIESYTHLTGIILQQHLLVQSLADSENRMAKIFKNTSAAISIHNSTGFLLVNETWEKICGYTAEEAKSLNPLQIVAPQERSRIKELLENRIVGKEVPSSFLMPIVDKNSNEKWVDISASLIDFEGLPAILIIANDVTHRIQDELELTKLYTAIVNVPLSIVITDIDGNMEYVNPYFCELTGYNMQEILGNNPKILQSGLTDQKVFRDMWSTILKGDIWEGEFINRKKSGEIYYERARIAPVLDNEGIIINFLAIKEDITERIKNLQQIKDSEKTLKELNAQKDKFFSIIAHDLRSPFIGIIGLTSLLKENYKTLGNEQIENYLELISQSNSHVFKLLENLLTWARTQTGKMEYNPLNINVSEMIQESFQVQQIPAKSKKIQLTNTVDRSVMFFADTNMVSTILRNLISNAIKYTHPGGEIKVGTTYQYYNNKKFVVVSVADSGVGIPKDKMNKIFKIEENYSTPGTQKEKGTGLGLILCKEFVELHRGKIWCKSSEGEGSTFYFSIPSA